MDWTIPDAALPWLLVLHAWGTTFMTGLVWLVQRVHYPMMAHLKDPRALQAYAAEHAARITPMVALAMLIEAATAAALALMLTPAALIGLILLAGVWILTFAVLVPMHARLQRIGDAALVRTLVVWNWPRTWLWTARSLLAFWMLLEMPSTPAA
jgi:hypothetical protein